MRSCVSCSCVSGEIDSSGRCPFCAEPVAPMKPVVRPVGRAVLEAVSESLDIPVAMIRGKRRLRPVVLARWAVMQALTEAGWSTPQIGRLLGGRDHTTVMHGLSQIHYAIPKKDWSGFRMALEAGRKAAAGPVVTHPYCGPPIVMVWGEPGAVEGLAH